MNTRLEMLFKKHNLPEKDRFEINQIFWLLPSNKQQNLLNNFDLLAIRLEQINKEINLERDILIGNEVDNIRNLIISSRINKEKEELKKELLNINNSN